MALPAILVNAAVNYAVNYAVDKAVKEAGDAARGAFDLFSDTIRKTPDADSNLGLGHNITKNTLELSDTLGTPAVVNAVNLGGKAMEIIAGDMANKVKAVNPTDRGL